MKKQLKNEKKIIFVIKITSGDLPNGVYYYKQFLIPIKDFQFSKTKNNYRWYALTLL